MYSCAPSHLSCSAGTIWAPLPIRRKPHSEIEPDGGAAPAVPNAVYAATGAQAPVLPLTPERVWRAMQTRA
jgi:CO/xanthine dehydrogenase Mo-binding subunit